MKQVTKDVTKSGKKTEPIALLKFAEKPEYLFDLLENGILYLSTMKRFRGGEIKEDDYIKDSLEGARHYMKVGPGTLSTNINGKAIKVPFIKMVANKNVPMHEGNISCFYSITKENFNQDDMKPIDLRMTKPYSHFMLITDYFEFVKRVEVALNKKRINCRFGFVEYFDEDNFSGELHPHHKRSRFSFQNEFRIFLYSSGKKAIRLKLGSLKDIARIHEADIASKIRARLNYQQGFCHFTLDKVEDNKNHD